MPRLVAPLALALVLAGQPVVAQDDSSPAGDEVASPASGYTATGDPLVGAAVPYLDADGEEIAVLTVREVADPFTRYGDFYAPEEDERYVSLELEVRATGGELRLVGFDVRLQTVDGFLYGSTFDPRDHQLLPALESEELREGEEFAGLLFYLLPAEAELARVVW